MSWYKRLPGWSLAALGSLLLWLAIGIHTGILGMESLYSNGISAALLAIPAIGQMIVITTGRGAIDLSIPSVITLSAFFATDLIDGQDRNILYACAVICAIAVLIGLWNSLLVLVVRIPPIIATLATGYILITGTLLYNQGFAVFVIAPSMLSVLRDRFLGVPIIIFVVALLALAVFYILRRTPWGMALAAIGQNLEAAYLAGVKIHRVRVAAYIASAILASLCGIFMSARVGGAFLGMGESFMMETVGAVVIGGTLIFGGRASTIGTLMGALFLVLVVTALQIMGLTIGMQNIVKGLLIIAVLVAARNDETY
jgi:Ribose/xylose/arabinose/galactoside ABC-type transport systems, permease components